MDEAKINALVEAVLKELAAARASRAPAQGLAPPTGGSLPLSAGNPMSALRIDLPDPTTPDMRMRPQVRTPYDADGLKALMAATTARIGVGR